MIEEKKKTIFSSLLKKPLENSNNFANKIEEQKNNGREDKE